MDHEIILEFKNTEDKSIYKEIYTIKELIYGIDGDPVGKLIAELRLEGYVLIDAYPRG